MYFFWFDVGVVFFVLVLFLSYVLKDNVLLQIIISVLICSVILFFVMISVSSFLASLFVLLIYASGLLLLLMYVSSMLSAVEVYKNYLLNFFLALVYYYFCNFNLMYVVVNKSVSMFSLYSDQWFFMLFCGGLLCLTLYLALVLLL